jgi:hypothetical protein
MARSKFPASIMASFRALVALAAFSLACAAYSPLDDNCVSGCCAANNGALGELQAGQAAACAANAKCLVVYAGSTRGGSDWACVALSAPHAGVAAYSKAAVASCIQSCGASIPGVPAATATHSFPPCGLLLGEVYRLEGDARLVRSGAEKAVSVGDEFCSGDTVAASPGSRVFVRFSDGSVRFVGNAAVMHVEEAAGGTSIEGCGAFEVVSSGNARLVVSSLLSESDERTEFDVLCGGRLDPGARPVSYELHSDVKFEFSGSSERVSVIEGNAVAVDGRDGAQVSIPEGTAFRRSVTEGAAQGSLSASGESGGLGDGGGGCCGAAFILLAGSLAVAGAHLAGPAARF